MTLLSISLVVATLFNANQQKPQPTSQPATTRPAASQPSRPPMTQRRPQQAAIYDQLLQRESIRPVVPTRGGEAATTNPAADQPEFASGVQLEGQTVHNRRVRLARSGDRVELIFRSEDGGPTTLVALENQLLEVMERESESGAREFIITGELTAYRGKNYIRVLKVLRPLDNGNLTP